MKKSTGVQVVTVSPFKSDAKIDEESVRRHGNFLTRHDVEGEDGVPVPKGSVGESHAMSIPERKRPMEIVIEESALEGEPQASIC